MYNASFIIFMVVIAVLNIISSIRKISKVKSRKVNPRRYRYNNNNARFINNMNRQMHHQFMDEMNRQQNQFFMEESLKTVTPWEMGGYDLSSGNSFNNFGNGMF